MPLAAMVTPPGQPVTMQLGNNTIQLGNPTMEQGNNTMLLGNPHHAPPQQVVITSTLPPVPAQLHQQIVQGEYVDFSFSNKTMFVDTTGQPSPSQRPNVTRISSFATWMEAWNIYLSVLLNNNPGRALELVGYQRLICLANKLLPINAWLQYDYKLCTIAAANLHLCWDQHHPDLWLEVLALGNLDKQTSKRWPCPYCKAITHYPENYLCSPFCDNLQSPRATNRRGSVTPICGDFNNGNCSHHICHFKHICLFCKDDHPRVSCSSRRTTPN